MNKFGKFGIMTIGLVGSMVAGGLISKGTTKLIEKLDSRSSDEEEGSTTDEDEAE